MSSGPISPAWFNGEADWYPSMNFIGSGVVFHVPGFFSELVDLEINSLSAVHDRILVSDMSMFSYT